MSDDLHRLAAWFAGPKAEQGEWFSETLKRIAQDYYAWRRNYFPEDGVVVDSALRRANEPFQDAFEDRLLELLARLKNDFPFHSPRYAAHMVAEQTLPSIAGYVAAMLYNPNNVSNEAAPVTVRLELEASRLIARMLGHGDDGWAHLTSGGTIANIEALWVARTVLYLPLVVRDMRAALRLVPEPWPDEPRRLLGVGPRAALAAFARVFADAARRDGAGPSTTARVIDAYQGSPFNVVEQGIERVVSRAGAGPALLLPETHHYCFEKAMDALGLGRRALVPVRVDSHFRMDIDDLRARLDALHADQRLPLAVVGVVGTTEEGAVDPIDRIVALRDELEAAGRGSFWLHADAAYGGYLRTMIVPTRIGLGEPSARVAIDGATRTIPITLPEAHACDALEALGECDSITIDPHKLGYIPYPAGAICFRSGLVKPITRQAAPYLEDAPGDAESERRADAIGVYILEGSKPGAAAAAVWLGHTLIPLDRTGHGVLVRETVRSAAELHALLEGYASWRGAGPGDPANARAVCLAAPGSNIVCYCFVPARDRGGREGRLARINGLNRAIYERFTMTAGERVYEQRFFVSRTVLTAPRYSAGAVASVLERVGATHEEFAREGLFLLRSVLMNPWYALAKQRGRYFLSELVEELHRVADDEAGRLGLA